MFKSALLSALLLSLIACSEPFLYFSGGELRGEQETLVDVPTSNGVMQIETLASDPYSVNIGYFVVNNQLYIDPAEDRQWYQNILVDPAVRIRFAGADKVHPMMTVIETDPNIISQFDQERIVLRLEAMTAE